MAFSLFGHLEIGDLLISGGLCFFQVQTLFKELLKSRSSPAVREIVMQLSQASQRLLGAKVRGQSSKVRGYRL